MPKYSREFLAELADRTSMIEVVSRHVQLKKRGGNWLGLCPFHQEKTPSFNVSEVRKAFKCFGCSEGGDAISFLQKIQGMSFHEAVEELAGRAGMELPKETFDPQAAARSAHKDKLFKANDVAAEFFARTLTGPAGSAGRDCLEERKIDAEFARTWRLGVAPDAWDGLANELQRQGIAPRIAEEAGLVIPRKGGSGYYDRFRNRLMFPITDPRGRVVAFGGRTLGDDDAKYINSPESPVYNKSSTLYGLYEGRTAIHKEDQLLVVEGYFDVLALARVGIGCAVAPCGTALTERQLTAIRRHTRNVILLFDADTAGKRAAIRSLGLCLEQSLWPSYLSVPDGKDPDDFVREHGGEAMRTLLDEQCPLMDFFVETVLEKAGTSDFATNESLEQIAPMLARMDPIQRSNYSRRIAGTLDVDPRVVQERVRRARPRKMSEQTPATARRNSSGNAAPGPRPPHPGDGPPHPADDASHPAYAGQPAERAGGIPSEQSPANSGGPAQARRPPTSNEQQLLRLMVHDLPSVAQAVEQYKILSWLDHPEVELAVARLLRANQEERTPTAMELLSGLGDPSVRGVLEEVLSRDDIPYSDEDLLRAERECFIRLRYDWTEGLRKQAARDLGIQERGGSDSTVLLPLLQRCKTLDLELQTLQDQLTKLLHPATD